MFQSIRKRIVRNTIIKVVISLLIIAGILIGSQFAPIKFFQKPEKIDINNVDADKYMDKYIEADFQAIYDYFGEVETTTTRHGITTSKKITSRYYISDMNEAYFIAVRADGEEQMDKLYDYMNLTNNTEDLSTLEGIKLKGTLTKMDSEEYSNLKELYYSEWIYF